LRRTGLRTWFRQLQPAAEGEPLSTPAGATSRGGERAAGAIGPDRTARIAAASVALLPALLGFAAVGGLAADNGGYFPTAWGWSAFGLFLVAALALVAGSSASLSRLELLFLAGLAVFAGWIATSLAWSGTPDTVLEVERALVYVAGTLAALLVVRRRTVPNFLGGVLVAIVLVSGYGLATRLLPDRIGVFDPVAVSRLAQPLGYWNALGIFAAMGSLLAIGFAARARTLLVRTLAAAAPVVLVPTLYFTFGRGPWITFGIGIAALVALDPRRLQVTNVLLLLTPAPALAVWLGSRSDALTHNQPKLSQAAVHDGHRLFVAILLLAAVTAAAMLVFVYAERWIRPGTVIRRVYGLALLLALAAVLGGIFLQYGGPATIVRRSYDAFKAPPVGITQPGSNLKKRLFSFSGNGRYDLWRIAWRDREDHAVLGSGAGTFERYWLRHRPVEGNVRDAHSLYFETLAELGPPGLALLLFALAVPFAAAVWARRNPLVPAAFGAYVAYVAHAGVDWDWEMPAVTLAGLLCGAALLVAARKERAAVTPDAFRAGLLVVALALAAFSYVGLRSNRAIDASAAAARKGEWSRSAAEARKAGDWSPWSVQAKQLLAKAQLAAGEAKAARATLSVAIAKDSGDWSLWKDLANASSGRAQRRALVVAIRLNPLASELAYYRASLRPASRRE
jgi:hypothetical protein